MKQKILLIDDDPLVLRSLEGILKKENYECAIASTPEKGICCVQNEDFNLIISDIRMPGKDGVETMKQVRKIFQQGSKKEIPIIFITGYADDAVMLNAEGLGEVVLKPFDLKSFMMTIREYL